MQLAPLSLTFAAGPGFVLPQSDCTLKGQGRLFEFNSTSGQYENNKTQSYNLSALRYKIGDGIFLYKETKTFSDGRAAQTTFFKQGQAAGPFDFSAPDGSLKTNGVCTRSGHCAGILQLAAVHFNGHFVTDFDAATIRTVTFGDDGSFVDETLQAELSCPTDYGPK